MTEAKPCLPECWKDHKPGPFQGFIYHAPGCPKAEAPKVKQGLPMSECSQPTPASAPKASEALVACGTCMEWDPYCKDCLRSSPPEEPAPAPELKQGSEEPIDWEKAELWAAGTAQGDARLSQVQAARAFLALLAEVDHANDVVDTLNLQVEDLRADLVAAREEIAKRETECLIHGEDYTRLLNHHSAEKARAAKAEERVKECLQEDAAGRSVPELLRLSAALIHNAGGGPIEDCLRLLADRFEAILAARVRKEGGGR